MDFVDDADEIETISYALFIFDDSEPELRAEGTGTTGYSGSTPPEREDDLYYYVVEVDGTLEDIEVTISLWVVEKVLIER